MTKYKEIISSPTFQLIAVVFILQVLQIFNIISDVQTTNLTNAVQVFLGTIAAIRASARIGSAKPNTTTVSIPEGVEAVTASTSKARMGVNKARQGVNKK